MKKNLKKAFILGNPRSGTSLLRIILNNHKNIIAPPESGFAHWWLKKYDKWQKKDCDNSSKLNSFINDLMLSRKIETWKLNFNNLSEEIKLTKPSNYSELITLVYLSFISKTNVKVIIDKNNYYINHLNELLKIWPDAYFIHLVRDGRDVASSYIELMDKDIKNLKYKPKLSKNIANIASEWANNVLSIEDFLLTIDKDKRITIKFEDLILSTIDTLNDLCEKFKIEFDDAMMNYYSQTAPKYLEPKETSHWKKKTTSPPLTSRVGRYHEDLSPSDLKIFSSIADEALSKFGYK